MVRKIIACIVISWPLYCAPGLYNAIDKLDVDEVVRILEHESPTDNELICHIEALRAKNKSYEEREALKLFMGVLGGTMIGILFGDIYWRKTANSVDLRNPKKAGNTRAIGALMGIGLAICWRAVGHNDAERAKTRTIKHLLTHKIGEKIGFFQRL